MDWYIRSIFIIVFAIILAVPIGIWSGIQSTSDYQLNELEFSELNGEVKVYRDNLGIPTIIASTNHDLFFVQGYEQARDRLFQMEFLKAVGNGDLARIFGEDLINSSKYLRNAMMHQAAEDIVNERTSSENLAIIDAYIGGVNKFIELHRASLPLEFHLTESEPTLWTRKDVGAIRSAMAFDLGFADLTRELLRSDLAKNLGVEKTLEIFPIESQEGIEYFLNSDPSQLPVFSRMVDIPFQVDIVDNEKGSNQWVIAGSETESGNPILSNDPHLGLTTPSIWWEVHLYSTDSDGFHLRGFALPGNPGITIGHNDHVAWGFTNTGGDVVDLFYFNTREESGTEQYFYDGEWQDFEYRSETIEVNKGEDITYEIKMTEYGPVLDSELFGIEGDTDFVFRWALTETNSSFVTRERIFDSLFDLMKAEDMDDVFDALENFSVPAQNIMFATVDGDIGYQYSGLMVDRRTPGSGVMPQNGSDPNFGWNSIHDYVNQYRVQNPSEGYFLTANEMVDKRDDFYITQQYAPPYRADRINESIIMMQENGPITPEMMGDLQGDVVNLYARDLLNDSGIMDILISEKGSTTEEKFDEAIDLLNSWDYGMTTDSNAALIFATFRIYLEEYTFKDELDQIADDTYERYSAIARWVMGELLRENSEYFDDVSTSSVIETKEDIIKNAMLASIEYLGDKEGSNIDNWKYGDLHKVTFEHPFGDLGIFDFSEGAIPNNGSKSTVNAAGQTTRWGEDGTEYSQTNGPSFRMVAEVEETWANVKGVVAPGQSAHTTSEHRDDQVMDWVYNRKHIMDFNITYNESPTTIFRKK